MTQATDEGTSRRIKDKSTLGGITSVTHETSEESKATTGDAAEKPRLLALDLFRGLLMVLQSIDHARLKCDGAVHEEWHFQPVFKDPIPTLTRVVTHPAAPGFAFMMGIGIVLFAQSRIRLGWSQEKLIRHFAVRGLVLIILNAHWTTVFSILLKKPTFATTVLFSLGVNYFIGGIIFLTGTKIYLRSLGFFEKLGVNHEIAKKNAHRIRNFLLLSMTVALLVGNVFQTPKADTYKKVDYGLWRNIWLLSGRYGFLYSIYPPLNWLSFTLYGILWGHMTLAHVNDRKYNVRFNLGAAFTLLLLFFMIRIPGKFGNINPDLLPFPPEGTLFNNPYLTSWMQFVNAIKYPPDLAFSTLYMGLNHLAFAGFYVLPTTVTSKVLKHPLRLMVNPLIAFGQSALFFYMLHFHVYYVIELLLETYIPGYEMRIREVRFWIFWAVGLVICWVMCLKYAKFKARKGPNSIWRFM